MKEKRVFTKKMALYLTDKGFKPIRVVPDINKPNFKNWIFEETNSLLKEITNYTREYK